MNVVQHIEKIEEWADDIVEDQPHLSKDEIWSDTVHAYLDSEVGTSTRTARLTRAAILDATGVGERSSY